MQPVVVSGLDDGKTYTCTLHATNAVGDGAESVSSDSFVPHDGIPEPPTDVSAVGDFDTGAIHVAFVELADGGSPITSFDVTCTSTNGGTTITESGASSPIDVPGGTPGKFYTCTVTATSDAGTSDPVGNVELGDRRPRARCAHDHAGSTARRRRTARLRRGHECGHRGDRCARDMHVK